MALNVRIRIRIRISLILILIQFVEPNKEVDSGSSLVSLLKLKQIQNQINNKQVHNVMRTQNFLDIF